MADGKQGDTHSSVAQRYHIWGYHASLCDFAFLKSMALCWAKLSYL